ncbi:M35 family metallo-endopeptidase [Yoonia sp.]|uniref:M35 family metallo-endopeptidase n=1 Tax=Yoonia sp. TaxID=2212373 RepID=UPI003F6A9E8B
MIVRSRHGARRSFGVVIICLLGLAQPAAALGLAGCLPDQARSVETDLRRAKRLTLDAAVAVGDTPDYVRWFGDYTPKNAEIVRANLKAVVVAIRSGAIRVECQAERAAGCTQREYAWVYPGQPYVLRLCPAFFGLPTLHALSPGAQHSDHGTREGTIVHELSHFTRVAGTEDYCYSRTLCKLMAQRDTRRAIINADSYQYFTEDVTYYARKPLADKPPPAAQGD